MISDNLHTILDALPAGVRLVAVSKLKPTDDILEAYAAGQRAFGENYATELRDKHQFFTQLTTDHSPLTTEHCPLTTDGVSPLPTDHCPLTTDGVSPLATAHCPLATEIEWHFIGHLQSKQLKYYIPFVSMIHGVDSLEHLADVDAAAAKAGRTVDVLLQVHVAQEETKFGFLPEELEEALTLNSQFSTLNSVRVCGLMAMASNTPDTARVRADFHAVRMLFERLKAGPFAGCPEFKELSMGMSHDWRIAVDEGSTIVRLGSSIFGPRDYSK